MRLDFFSNINYEKPIKSRLCCGSALILTMAIFSVPLHAIEELNKIKLDPMKSMLLPQAGEEYHWLKDGNLLVVKVISIEDGVAAIENSEGCRYSNVIGTFAPAVSWENCGGHTGGVKISKSKGSLFPLKAKNKFSFRGRGFSNKGESWDMRRTCKVKSGVKIKTHTGEHDTYKIVCVQGNNTRTYYLSPAENRVVAFKRKHKKNRKDSYTQELVKVVSP